MGAPTCRSGKWPLLRLEAVKPHTAGTQKPEKAAFSPRLMASRPCSSGGLRWRDLPWMLTGSALHGDHSVPTSLHASVILADGGGVAGLGRTGEITVVRTFGVGIVACLLLAGSACSIRGWRCQCKAETDDTDDSNEFPRTGPPLLVNL